MDQARQHLSFGRYLRFVRLEKGIDLETVAAATRIGTRVLRSIEDEDLAELPAEVFVKGFLRAYARQIGVDGDDVVARYMLGRSPVAVIEKRQPFADRRGTSFWLRMLVALSGLAAIMAASVAVTLPPGRSRPPEASQSDRQTPAAQQEGTPSSVPEPASVPETSAEPKPATVPEVQPPSTAAPAPAERHTLQVLALAPTWLKIIVDRQTPEEYSLRVHDRLDFEAASGFRLLIGNAAAVIFDNDSNPLRSLRYEEKNLFVLDLTLF